MVKVCRTAARLLAKAGITILATADTPGVGYTEPPIRAKSTLFSNPNSDIMFSCSPM